MDKSTLIVCILLLAFAVGSAVTAALNKGRKWRRRAITAAAVLSLSGVSGSVDFARAKVDKAPVFSVAFAHRMDGGTKEFIGFLYFITVYHTLDGLRGPKLRFWWLPFHPFSRVWDEHKIPIVRESNTNQTPNQVSGANQRQR